MDRKRNRLVRSAVAFAAVGAALFALPQVAAAENANDRGSSTNVDCDAGTDLAATLASAAPGSTIFIRGRCVGAFTIDKRLRLRGLASATLDATGTGTTLTIGRSGVVELRDIAITGGSGTTLFGPSGSVMLQGGGVLNLGRVHLRGVEVRGNSLRDNTAAGFDGFGAGVLTMGSFVSRRGRISANSGSGSVSYGGGLVNGGTARLDRTDIVGNTMSGNGVSGGGISNSGTAVLRRLAVHDNSVTGVFSAAGGGIQNGGKLTLDRVEVTANRATSGRPNATGGGIVEFTPQGITFIRSTVHDNIANDCEPANLCPAQPSSRATDEDLDEHD